MKRSLLWTLVCATVLPTASGACSRERDKVSDQIDTAASASASVAPGLLSFQASAQEQQRAEELAKSVNQEQWQFPSEQWRAEADEKAALLLAATAEEPAVIGAALAALRSLAKPGKKPSDDTRKVIQRHLLSDDHRVASRALALAKPALTGAADPELLKSVVSLGQTNAFQAGSERYEVLVTLSNVGVGQRRGAVDDLLLASLNAPEPFVVITALRQLHNPKLRARVNKPIAQAALPLLTHSEPAVRGLAAILLGQTAKADSGAAQALLAALGDKSPYVRSQAATALTTMQYTPGLHALLPLIGDLEKNNLEYEVRGLEGRASRQVLSGSYWPHVAAAAQEAATRLAPATLKLKFEPVAPKDVPGTLKTNAKTFMAWYQAHKSKLPKAEAGVELSGEAQAATVNAVEQKVPAAKTIPASSTASVKSSD
jgi:hypothetical protein